MKVLAFAATNSRKSINRALIGYVAERLKATIRPDAEIEFLDLNAFEMPIYSIDRENASGVPEPARQLFERIGAADAVIVSFAEHNGSVTAAWKNIFDWMSRIEGKLWQDKPLVIFAATPGPRAGKGVLGYQEMLAPFFGADLKGKYGVGSWKEAWDADAATLTRQEDVEGVDAAIAPLADDGTAAGRAD